MNNGIPVIFLEQIPKKITSRIYRFKKTICRSGGKVLGFKAEKLNKPHNHQSSIIMNYAAKQ